MSGFEIRFNIYAETQAEADAARQAIINFIAEHAKQGRAVTGKKIVNALSRWKDNILVRNKIIDYFK